MRKGHRPLLEPMVSPGSPGKRAILILIPSEIRLGTDTNEAPSQAEESSPQQQASKAPSSFPPSEPVLRTRIRPVSLTPDLGCIGPREGRRTRGQSLLEKKCLTPKLQALLDVPLVPPLPLPFLKKHVRRRKERKATLPPLSPYRFLEVEGVSHTSAPSWDLNRISPVPKNAFRRRLTHFTEGKSHSPSHDSEAVL